MNVLFISEDYLKEITPTNLNVDVKEVYSHLLSAQDINIQSVLGSKLYNELKTAITNNTVTTDQETLLQLIKPACAWWSLVFSFRWMNYKIKNIGVQKAHSENAESADKSEMIWLLEDLNNRAEFYSERIREYLLINGSKYPSYLNPDILGMPDTSTQFSSGVFFPSKSNDCCDGIDPQDKGFHQIN